MEEDQYITLILLFFLKNRLTIFVIGKATIFTVQLNGSGRADIDMSLPNFAGEELDIEVTDG